jgi:hypothetical protein
MADNLLSTKPDWLANSRAPRSKESQQPVQGFPQGRRVTLGGINRRSSIGIDQINDALFGRRSSGFSELDVLARRGSLDSTTSVFDAAIMNLTRRRLSIVGGVNDPLSIDPLGSIGSFKIGDMASLNPSPALPSNTSQAPLVNPLTAHQQQLLQEQCDLEQKQKELELQRHQLVAAMEQRHLAMQALHQKMQIPENQQMQRKSLNLSGAQGLLMGLQNPGFVSIPSLPTTDSNRQQQWFVCKLCNSKAFSNREEAIAHESLCIMGGLVNTHISIGSIGDMRRSSLGLLGTLAGTSSDLNMSNFGSTLSGLNNGPNQVQCKPVSTKFNLNAVSEHPSKGPFAMMEKPQPLAMDLDKDWLTPLHCFVRKHCVQIFTATEMDLATPSKGKRKRIQVGQVGIRCPHCYQGPATMSKERGSVYYPTSISSIYNATMNLLQRHLHNCSAVPADIMQRYETLKGDDARSGTSKKYWVKSAVSLGLVDTSGGIRYTGIAQLLESQSQQSVNFGQVKANDYFSYLRSNDLSMKRDNIAGSNTAYVSENKLSEGGMHDFNATGPDSLPQSTGVVTPEDESHATAFSYALLSQMQPCVFAEADRLGKRKDLPPGFPGLACTHCFEGYGSGRFFPSSIKTLSDTSKTLNVLHNHMMRCRKCPVEVREKLISLRKTHDDERSKMKFGSQKAFFARIWDRLHHKDPSCSAKRKFQPSRVQPHFQSFGTLNPSNVASFPPTNVLGQSVDQGNIWDILDSNKRLKLS